MKKRSHRNTTRLTARERAGNALASFCMNTRTTFTVQQDNALMAAVEGALQAHARAALRRARGRR